MFNTIYIQSISPPKAKTKPEKQLKLFKIVNTNFVFLFTTFSYDNICLKKYYRNMKIQMLCYANKCNLFIRDFYNQQLQNKFQKPYVCNYIICYRKEHNIAFPIGKQ